MIVTGIQINSRENSKENLDKVFFFLEKACASNPDVIILPEYSNYMGPLEKAYPHALPEQSHWHKQLSYVAKQNNVGIIAGLLLREQNGKSSSSVIYFNKQGKQQCTYNKLHLFDVDIDARVKVCESAYLIPGNKPVITEINGITSSFALCYDLRFPELFRHLTGRDVRVLYVPAAFTEKTGKAHWELLVRTRAVENQIFIVAVNQVGLYDTDKMCYGNSMIVDPWGTILARAPGIDGETSEGIISASLDFIYQDKIRKKLPCLSHRRRDLFD